MSPPRNEVFVSYARKDRKWKERLVNQLAPLVRNNRLSLWDDSQIVAGTDWRNEIQQALQRARVAVLLVSPHFLASSFIADNELPQLLRRAEAEGVRIIGVAVTASLYEATPIAAFQAANDPGRPLDTYVRSPYRVEAELVRIAKHGLVP